MGSGLVLERSIKGLSRPTLILRHRMFLRRVGLDARRDRAACRGSIRLGDPEEGWPGLRSRAGRGRDDRAVDAATCELMARLR